MNLSEIKLGNADGRKESKIDSYQSMFYEDDLTYGVLKKEKSVFIIKGRKGVGKTLLSQYFMDECKKGNNSLCRTIGLKDIEATFLKEVGNSNGIKKEEYSLYLKYCVLLEIAKLVVDEKPKAQVIFKDKFNRFLIRKRIKKFLNERYPNTNYRKTDVCEEIDNGSKGKALVPASEISFDNNIKIKSKITKNEYFNIMESLEKLILKYLRFQTIILSTDDVDEINDVEISNENFKYFLLSYIKACEGLNEKFQEISDSRCLIVVRDDIVNSLNAINGNFNKILADCSITIDWLESGKMNPWEYKIAKMILRKIKYSVDKFKNLSDEEIYYKVFPDRINENEAFHYLVINSNGRPREIIFLLNTIIRSHGNSDSFKEQYFYEAMVQYSEHLLGDIKNEMSFYFDANYIEDIFNLLIKMDKKVFKLQNIKFVYENNRNEFTSITNIEKVVEDLYNFNIIGIIGNKIMRDGKSITTWAFRDKNNNRFRINQKFTVHFGLRKALFL